MNVLLLNHKGYENKKLFVDTYKNKDIIEFHIQNDDIPYFFVARIRNKYIEFEKRSNYSLCKFIIKRDKVPTDKDVFNILNNLLYQHVYFSNMFQLDNICNNYANYNVKKEDITGIILEAATNHFHSYLKTGFSIFRKSNSIHIIYDNKRKVKINITVDRISNKVIIKFSVSNRKLLVETFYYYINDFSKYIDYVLMNGICFVLMYSKIPNINVLHNREYNFFGLLYNQIFDHNALKLFRDNIILHNYDIIIQYRIHTKINNLDVINYINIKNFEFDKIPADNTFLIDNKMTSINAKNNQDFKKYISSVRRKITNEIKNIKSEYI